VVLTLSVTNFSKKSSGLAQATSKELPIYSNFPRKLITD